MVTPRRLYNQLLQVTMRLWIHENNPVEQFVHYRVLRLIERLCYNIEPLISLAVYSVLCNGYRSDMLMRGGKSEHWCLVGRWHEAYNRFKSPEFLLRDLLVSFYLFACIGSGILEFLYAVYVKKLVTKVVHSRMGTYIGELAPRSWRPPFRPRATSEFLGIVGRPGFV